MNEGKQNVVAIDGPAGSGKSTIAKSLARETNSLYINTGLMFRAVGHIFKNQNIDALSELDIKNTLKDVEFSYEINDPEGVIYLGNVCIDSKLNSPDAGKMASKISRNSFVRSILLELQRSLVSDKQMAIMEGRDIGTIVFPNAFCKIFLTASAETRAQRRVNQLSEMGKKEIDFDHILSEIKERDERDKNRKIAPLKMAKD